MQDYALGGSQSINLSLFPHHRLRRGGADIGNWWNYPHHLVQKLPFHQRYHRVHKGILPHWRGYQAIDRAGHKPQLVKVPTERREQVKIIAQDLVERRDSGAESIAVICRSAHDSRQVHLLLTEELLDTPVTLISDDDDRLRPGIVVIPSYLAKGLEFDSVLVLDAEQYAEPERKLFYTVCTRAQHHLQIYFADRLPPLAPGGIDGPVSDARITAAIQ